jgi:hypothetical protein
LALTFLQVVYLAVAVYRAYLGGRAHTVRDGVLAVAIALLLIIVNSWFLTAIQLTGAAIALAML